MYEIQIPEPHYPGIERDVHKQVLDQVTQADAVGFHYFWTVEHHFLWNSRTAWRRKHTTAITRLLALRWPNAATLGSSRRNTT